MIIKAVDGSDESLTIYSEYKEEVINKTNLRIKALMVSAFQYLETLAQSEWSSKDTGIRYLEGLYMESSTDGDTVNLHVREKTLASMLEDGYPAFSQAPALVKSAVARGGRMVINIGPKGVYSSPVQQRTSLPSQDRLLELIHTYSETPETANSVLDSFLHTREANDTAKDTKPMGTFSPSSTPSFVTVTSKTPLDTFRLPAYRGALLFDKVAAYIELHKDAFFSDILPEKP